MEIRKVSYKEVEYEVIVNWAHGEALLWILNDKKKRIFYEDSYNWDRILRKFADNEYIKSKIILMTETAVLDDKSDSDDKEFIKSILKDKLKDRYSEL